MIESMLMTGRFECPVCDARFITLGDKKRHMRTTHKED